MRRHLISGRFGPNDNVHIPRASDEKFTILDLLRNDTLGHGINKLLSDFTKLSLYPNEVGVDLMIVALHIHAADTRISRIEESQDGWTREIRLVSACP